ncbi:MAG: LysR family transcriptional regulator [Gemmatimonadota bacterium]
MSADRLPVLEMRDLRLVVAVAEHGGLTRAAPHLNATQSALSHQLKELETRLGSPLFERVGRRMIPTMRGERLITRAREILGALCEAEDALIGTGGAPEARIRLATECYTCYHWLPPILQRYSAEYPRVEVQVVADATDQTLPALVTGMIDVAIAHSDVRDRRLTGQKLFKDEVVAIMSPQHPLARKEYIEPADLQGEHVYLYSELEHSWVYRAILRPAGVPPRQTTRIALTEATVELVKAGLGIAFLARWAVQPHVRDRTIRAVSYGRTGLHRTWHLVTRKDPEMPVHLRAFTGFLRESFRLSPRSSKAPQPLRVAQ